MRYGREFFAVALFGVAAIAAGHAAAGAAPSRVAIAGWPAPPTLPPQRPVTDVYGTTRVVDRYRYFENMQLPAVQDFFRRENAYARAVLAKLEPGRSTLLASIAALDNAGPTVIDVQRVGDQYFYEKRAPRENTLKLYVRHVGQNDERLLVDPDKLVTAAGKHYTIEYFSPSFDGTYVGYGVSEGGSENATLHVVETATGTILPDSIDRAKYVGVTGWRPDGKSFYYMRFPKLTPGESPERLRTSPRRLPARTRTRSRPRPAVFGFGVDPSLPFAPTDFAVVATTPNSTYALGIVAHGVQNEQTIYAAPLESVTGAHVAWKKVADVADDVTGEDLEGSTLYLLTHKDAPTYKIVATNLDCVPTSLTRKRSYLGCGDHRSAFGRKRRPVRACETRRFRHDPARGVWAGLCARAPRRRQSPCPSKVPSARWRPTRASRARRSISFHGRRPNATTTSMSSGTVSDTGLRPPSTIDTSAYTSQEALATSKDGTQVPISLVYRKGLVRDGTHPAYLEGYGSYGITIEPYFLGTRFAWLQQGGVWAVCHPRGGGWFGEDWHRAGMIATKQHTIDDFIACGRYLVAQKYTSPQHLAGEGTSAGGITIGRSITEAPACSLPPSTLSASATPCAPSFRRTGRRTCPSSAACSVPADVAPLLNMDAYLHVVDGTKYPAVMLNTGINDPRVSPWELAKFAARLQSASTSGRPILLTRGLRCRARFPRHVAQSS